jgi:hypothetical protein
MLLGWWPCGAAMLHALYSPLAAVRCRCPKALSPGTQVPRACKLASGGGSNTLSRTLRYQGNSWAKNSGANLRRAEVRKRHAAWLKRPGRLAVATAVIDGCAIGYV